jgi:hypothetical protein
LGTGREARPTFRLVPNFSDFARPLARLPSLRLVALMSWGRAGRPVPPPGPFPFFPILPGHGLDFQACGLLP